MIKLSSHNKAVFPAKRKQNRKLIVRLLGTSLLLIFLFRLNLNFEQIAQSLLNANLWFILSAILLIIPIIITKAYRWQQILAGQNLSINFSQALALYGLGVSLGSFTPGQLGDFLKAWYLKNKGYALVPAVVSVIYDRLFDLGLLVLLTLGGLFFLNTSFNNYFQFIFLTIIGLLLILALLFSSRLQKLTSKIITKAITKFTKIWDETNPPNPSSTNYFELKRVVVKALGATVFTSLLAVLRVWLLASAIGLNFSFIEVLVVSGLATIAGLIPISVAGIGSREVTLIGVLGNLGYTNEVAISLSTLLLALSLVNLLGGFVLWLLFRVENEANF
jgi:glycosyltransferase 2 family protein